MTLQLQISLPDCDIEFREFENVTQLVIGRSEKCDLSLPIVHDLSRQHAKLEFSGGQWFLSDLGSKFGTFVNDVRIEQPVSISESDIVRLGGLAKIKLVGKTKIRERRPVNTGRAVGLEKASAPPRVLPSYSESGSFVSTASHPVVIRDDNTGARPWHIGLAFLTAIVSAALLFWYLDFTQDQPKRGYTLLGMTTGICRIVAARSGRILCGAKTRASGVNSVAVVNVASMASVGYR